MRELIYVSAAAAAIALCVPAAFAAQPAVRSVSQVRSPVPTKVGMAKVIETQANPRGVGLASALPPDPATANSPVPPAMPADPNYHAGPYVGALTPPPQQAMNKVYPLCSKFVQDSCINPGARSAKIVR